MKVATWWKAPRPPRTLRGRLTLAFVSLTALSLWGIGLVLGNALNDFFVTDAQSRLRQQAQILAGSPMDLQAAALLTARQNQVQVLIYSSTGQLMAGAQGVVGIKDVPVPPTVVRDILAGRTAEGRWVRTDAQYPWWLYSTASVRFKDTSQGAVYVAMPLLRPRLFAQQVTGLVMVCVGGALLMAVLVGLGLARTIAGPLGQLAEQARRLEAGEYQARCTLTGDSEIARLGQTFNSMAGRLETTIASLKAQEVSRRELVANISHDLRTPLTALRISLEAIIDGVVEGDQVKSYLEKIRKETVYLGSLIDQLMFLARSDSGQLEVVAREVSVIELVSDALARVESQAIVQGVFLDGVWPERLPSVWLDPSLTAQILANLLDNAVKYTPTGGTVTLEARCVEGRLAIVVRDTGDGMDPHVLARGTERFYRGDRARSKGGFGLGLAIAERLCALQGISMQIASTPGQGTEATLSVPSEQNSGFA
ncbi:MAG: HAMP domain-containing histidine kinase [Gemmatimonadaceae bacterium]|nr:HAMP domain-containing histidine kinase [Gloeobacterales cyanobacterium ES-bin-141]